MGGGGGKKKRKKGSVANFRDRSNSILEGWDRTQELRPIVGTAIGL